MTNKIALSDEAEGVAVFWNTPDDSLHPVSRICAVLELAHNTLQNMRANGEGPDCIKRGGKIYYRKSAVVSWMQGEQGRRPAATQSPHAAA